MHTPRCHESEERASGGLVHENDPVADLSIRSGPWSPEEIRAYLTTVRIPVRLASNGRTYPLVQSLWFLFADDALWCCTRGDSVLARRLARDPHCAFEVSADEPPYRGVRGQIGRAHV